MATRVLLSCQFSVAYGGVQHSLLDLVRYLDRTRFEPIVLCSPEGELPELVASAQGQVRTVGQGKFFRYSYKWPLSTARDLFAVAREILRLAREDGVRIVHTFDGAVFCAASIARLFVQDLKVIWLDAGFAGYYPAHFRLVMRWCFRRAARVTSATDIRRRQLLAEGLDPALSAVMPLGTDIHLRAPIAPTAETDAREFRIGIVGRITPIKNFEMFLRAARLVADQHPNARFDIVGAAGLFGDEQAYYQQILAQIRALDLTAKVRILAPREDVAPLLQEFDVLACSSHIETFGRTLIEAMALGKPVVATAFGGIPEVIADGQTGFLVPADDAEAMAARINQLLSDASLRAAMGQRGVERVLQHFDVRLVARRWEQLYQEVLAQAS